MLQGRFVAAEERDLRCLVADPRQLQVTFENGEDRPYPPRAHPAECEHEASVILRTGLPERDLDLLGEEAATRDLWAHCHPQGVDIVLGRGRLLRIGPAFDAPTLRRLLALLEEGQP